MTFAYVLVFASMSGGQGLELKTYDTLESCEAASIAFDKELKRINDWYAGRRSNYDCVPKPASCDINSASALQRTYVSCERVKVTSQQNRLDRLTKMGAH